MSNCVARAACRGSLGCPWRVAAGSAFDGAPFLAPCALAFARAGGRGAALTTAGAGSGPGSRPGSGAEAHAPSSGQPSIIPHVVRSVPRNSTIAATVRAAAGRGSDLSACCRSIAFSACSCCTILLVARSSCSASASLARSSSPWSSSQPAATAAAAPSDGDDDGGVGDRASATVGCGTGGGGGGGGGGPPIAWYKALGGCSVVPGSAIALAVAFGLMLLPPPPELELCARSERWLLSMTRFVCFSSLVRAWDIAAALIDGALSPLVVLILSSNLADTASLPLSGTLDS